MVRSTPLKDPIILGPDGRPIRTGGPGSSRFPLDGRIFGPGKPEPPAMPEGTPPRALQPPVFINTLARPRAWQTVRLTAFDQLRLLADADLVRIAIQDVKGQIEGMTWQIAPVEGVKSSPALEKQIEAAKAWVRLPDPLGQMKFRSWLSQVLEEILVTDALTLYPRTDRAKRPIGLEQIDGATIVPLVDDRGRYPVPPEMAYQQIIHGRVETSFQLGELWYLPRNRRPDTPYGRPPVEMVLITVNLSLRSQMFDLAYYTEGDVPDGLYEMTEGWDADMVQRFEENWYALLAGDDAQRRRMRFVPQGRYTATKTREWDYEFQEFLARVIAWAFGVSPMPIAKVMNRATAEQMEVSATESGVRPVAQFIAEIVTQYIQEVLGFTDLRFQWGSDETEDSQIVYQRSVAQTNAGHKTLNEIRRENGDDPYPSEIGDRPFILGGPSGVIFLDEIVSGDGGTNTVAGELPESDLGEEAPLKATKPEEADRELSRWRAFVVKRLLTRRPLRRFESPAIPASTREFIESSLTAIPSDLPPGEAALIARLIFDGARLKKRFEKDPPKSLAKPTARIERAIKAWLKGLRDEVIREALAELEAKAPAEKLAKAIDDLDLSADDLFDDIQQAISDALQAGAKETAAEVAFEFDLDTAPETALAYSRERAAELVGRRFVDGRLVENPNPRFAITETLRSDIKSKVTQAIDNGWSPQRLTEELTQALGPSRAETVARTETGFAYNEGAIKVYETGGQRFVEILDGDGCLPKGHRDGSDPSPGEAGTVYPDKLADGQVWTVDQFRQHRLGHPRCVRAGVPHEESS